MSSLSESKVKEKSADESLIDLVRMNPLLFEKDKRTKPYESIKKKSEVWKSIATSLELEPNFCVARWKQLCDRYRRCIAERQTHEKQSKQTQPVDEWPLMAKMRFLDKYVNPYHHHSHKLPERSQQVSIAAAASATSNAVTAQQIFGGVNYDEPLPEAMDEQPLLAGEATKRNIVLPTSTQSEPIGTTVSPVLVRIEALLGGLDQFNRSIAEKRILSYLCKCQLKILDGESVEDIQL